ncbi:hypothetical protein LUZ60_001761 [Juncus effusus]|nr:hypothetical protein LUZ60_001761 [Juncus effusus]
MITKILSIFIVIITAWAYNFMKPPAPLICGTPGGPPVTSPRIKLKDGRFLAYKESGVPKSSAKYKIIIAHGFDNTKENGFPASQKLIEQLEICFISFDRAGYGESDPNPMRSIKSEAFDIEELANQLDLGDKFYVIGGSMGSYSAWSCLKFIPHRLHGAALVVPVVNYWWKSLPKNLTKNVFNKLDKGDQKAFWVAHNLPFLLYGWMKMFKSSPAIVGHRDILTDDDFEVIKKRIAYQQSIGFVSKSRQQGESESLYRDLKVVFGNWEFEPTDLQNPFPNNEGSVHIWTGKYDKLCPIEIQRYVISKLPWVKYHENENGGHLFVYMNDWGDKVVKSLLLGEDFDDM